MIWQMLEILKLKFFLCRFCPKEFQLEVQISSVLGYKEYMHIVNVSESARFCDLKIKNRSELFPILKITVISKNLLNSGICLLVQLFHEWI